MAQPRSLAYRGSTRPYPEGNDSDGSRSPQEEKKARKRNSVACARCRKRKIKCTGDNHDGNGCEACQAAGVSKASCHYLRVNSHNIEDVALQVASDSDWPYTPPAPANYTTRYTSDPSQYAFSNIPQQGTTSYASPGGPYSAAQTRPPNNNYQTSFNGSYDVQRPLQGPTPSHYALEYPPQWQSFSSHGRPNPHGLLYDQDPSRYETSTVSYMTSTGTSVPNVAAEGSSIFPGLSPLVSHLPAHSGNRRLPSMSIQPSFDSSSGSIHGDGIAGLYQQHLETATSQRSVSSASQDAISATGQGSSTSSSSPSETQENSTFSYTPIGRSPSGSGENPLGFHSVGISTTSNIDSYTTDSMSSIRSSQHANSELPRLNSSFDGCGGHRGSHPPDRTLESGMAIRSGKVYDPHGRPRMLQPQPQRSPSYDLLKGSFEGSDQHPAKVRKSSGHGRRSDGKR